MFGDIGKMMQNVQGMRERMRVAEEELKLMQVVGKSKNRMVSVTVDGKLNLISIVINSKLMAKNDVKVIEESVAEALRKALSQAKEKAVEKLSMVTKGVNYPGLI